MMPVDAGAAGVDAERDAQKQHGQRDQKDENSGHAFMIGTAGY
jgi:hypothetical protein